MKLFGPFSHYADPYRSRIFKGVACIALAQAAGQYVPMLIKGTIDALEGGDPALQAAFISRQVGYIVALAVVVALGGYTMRRLLGSASTRIEYDIRTSYFVHLLSMPLSYYQTQRTGDLMSRATNDLNSVRIFFTYGVRGIVESLLGFVLTIGWMCYLDWQLTLIVLLPVPLFLLFLTRMATLVHNRFKAIQEFFGQMSNFVQENMAGIRVVKAYVQSSAQEDGFDQLNSDYLEKNRGLVLTRAVYRPLTHMIGAVCLGLNLWYGGKSVISGEMSLGTFVAFNAYLTQLIRPIMYTGWVIDRFQRAVVSMRRINEVMEVKPDIANRADHPDAPHGEDHTVQEDQADQADKVKGAIGFRQLNFSYDGAPVLRDIELDIPAGATIGIMGRVGAGKTTLARLLPRLIEAGPGQLLIDGRPIEAWPLDQLRAAIGYVSQNPFLFSNTMAANLGYGVDDPTPEAVAQAAEEAQVRQDIEDFEQGFETLIGERGVTLSGGQKQRSTLARALMRRPRILILDDALSAVDTHTEEAILGHLRQIMRGRTTLIIAHRVSSLRDADRIIILDEGRIAEQGTHEELVKAGGFYADLHARQQLAAELETL
jgi:ATP-binding cassette, subfamily B, multidrug efflux pump